VLHVVGLPLATGFLIAIHFWRIRKDGGITGPLRLTLLTAPPSAASFVGARYEAPHGKAARRFADDYPQRAAAIRRTGEAAPAARLRASGLDRARRQACRGHRDGVAASSGHRVHRVDALV